MKLGDTVRVRDPKGFIASFGKRIADRDAEVVALGEGWRSGCVKVRFLKRNGRGREFEEWMRTASLEIRSPADPGER